MELWVLRASLTGRSGGTYLRPERTPSGAWSKAKADSLLHLDEWQEGYR